jgi:hypothetical protein
MQLFCLVWLSLIAYGNNLKDRIPLLYIFVHERAGICYKEDFSPKEDQCSRIHLHENLVLQFLFLHLVASVGRYRDVTVYYRVGLFFRAFLLAVG